MKPWLACAVLSILSACASGGGSRTASQAEIDAYISEASTRFNMPELWIREVIRQESGGRTTMNGRPIVSKAGAMGLMQVMPTTYADMRRKHDLGSDPYDPHDNIIAGTAYLRDMYNLFGAPGFLGAYNCGPGCYGDYLAGKRGLPSETKRYIAAVGPRLNRTPSPNGNDIVLVSAPQAQSQAEPPAARYTPPPAGAAPVYPPSSDSPTYAAPYSAEPYSPPASSSRQPITVAALPAPIAAQSGPVRVVAPDSEPPSPRPAASASGGFGRVWTVQLGAFKSPEDSTRVIERARNSLPGSLSRTQKIVQPVDTLGGPLYRARLTGLTQQDAASACNGLVGLGMACFVVAPGA